MKPTIETLAPFPSNLMIVLDYVNRRQKLPNLNMFLESYNDFSCSEKANIALEDVFKTFFETKEGPLNDGTIATEVHNSKSIPKRKRRVRHRKRLRRVKAEYIEIQKEGLMDNSYHEFDTCGSKAKKDLIVNKDFLEQSTKKFEPSSDVIFCEDVLLGEKDECAKLSNANNVIVQSNVCKTKNQRSSPLAMGKYNLSSEPSEIVTSNSFNAAAFEKLLSYAHTSPLRASRNIVMYDPVRKSDDIYSNSSKILKYNASQEKPPIEQIMTNFENLPDLKKLPCVGEMIAFKSLEMLDDYTPAISDYKTGDVVEIFTENETLRVRMHTPYRTFNKPRVGKFEISDPDFYASNTTEMNSDVLFQWKKMYNTKKINVH